MRFLDRYKELRGENQTAIWKDYEREREEKVRVKKMLSNLNRFDLDLKRSQAPLKSTL